MHYTSTAALDVTHSPHLVPIVPSYIRVRNVRPCHEIYCGSPGSPWHRWWLEDLHVLKLGFRLLWGRSGCVSGVSDSSHGGVPPCHCALRSINKANLKCDTEKTGIRQLQRAEQECQSQLNMRSCELLSKVFHVPRAALECYLISFGILTPFACQESGSTPATRTQTQDSTPDTQRRRQHRSRQPTKKPQTSSSRSRWSS